MMYAAIMGYGTIGTGVAEILETSREKIAGSALSISKYIHSQNAVSPGSVSLWWG